MKFDRENLIYNAQSKQAYQLIIPVFFILVLGGCFAPSFLEILDFKIDAGKQILGNLLTAFIAIPSTVLAIAAVLFAILQIANRKISFVQLVFENSGVIPVIYWATLNSVALILTQLLEDSLSAFWFLRILTCLTYNLIILLMGLFYTLYRTFRYLDYTNITDDYIKNINRLVRKELMPASEEQDHQQLRQRGKEVYAEVTDAVAKDDAVLISKFLKSFAYALAVNPSSNYITDFNRNLAGWIVKAIRLKSRLLGPLIEFWRTQFTLKFTGAQSFRFDNVDRVPLLSYTLVENDDKLRKTVIDVFSIRLKEMAQKQCFLAQENGVLRDDANFNNLFPLFIEYSELMRYLIAQSDTTSLKVILNDIKMMRETFIDGDYRTIRTQVLVNRSQANPINTDTDHNKFTRYAKTLNILREIDMIVIGNLSWVYFRLFGKKITVAEFSTLPDIINLLHEYLRNEEAIETMVHLYNYEDNRMLWDDWIWHGEERLSGKAYTIASISDLLAAGFAGMLIRQHYRLGRHSVNSLEDLRFLIERSRAHLAKIQQEPGEWPQIFGMEPEALQTRISQVYDMLDGMENNIQDEHTAELARTPTSPEKIQAFKELMQQQWEESRDLSRVFEHFAAVEINPDYNLIDGGDNVSLAKGKVMFIDGPLYNFIYGMQFGKRVNDTVASRLAEIAGAAAEENTESTLAEIFEKGIKALAESKKQANAILVDYGLFYTHEISLNVTGKYTSINNHQNPYDFNIAGFYNNSIPIIAVQSFSFQDLVIIADLPNGLVMQQRQSDDYYDRRLILEINAIDEAQAPAILAERQAAGNRAATTITELMASMDIHIHQIFDFKIVDSKAVRIYRTTIENLSRD